MHSESSCCLSVDALFLVIFMLRTIVNSNLRDEHGEYRGIASRAAGRKEVQFNLLSFLVLAVTYAGLFYLIHVEPNVHTGHSIPWATGIEWVLHPLLAGMVYLILGTLIVTKMYRPDT